MMKGGGGVLVKRLRGNKRRDYRDEIPGGTTFGIYVENRGNMAFYQ